MSVFILSDKRDDGSRERDPILRDFRAVFEKGRLVVSLTVEVRDAYEIGYTLKQLEEIKAAHAPLIKGAAK
ncbi:hypothetical protein [Paracoccus sp. (in: a-proteobacteria)]|uniref:hypothetical protein n=1 Tax=Paracoccus sp. TaxID=267 RepID=UPI0026DF0930|nr:hypothetical protein [Paracoccus sp. (in: a-proteobacteria)]MDO5648362.1 hypothetical protein [Paracoccus sp. (in: a-proteobacteria)]